MMDEREEEEEEEEAWLQLRPVEPLPSQCCGSGCSPCVFDLYHRELARWEAARASKDRGLLSGEESQSCPSKLNPETFLAFRISAVDRLTKDTYRVRFALPRNSRLGLRPGQHLILRGKVDDLEIQRAYTPISPANAEGYFEVLIKCYQTGLMSRYVESWSAGDTAFWRGPFGDFFYKPNQYGELLMLASGTGLAPMVPVLQSITDNAEDETFVTLVGCFKTFEGIYLKTFLQEQARFWNVRTFFVLSQENSPEQLPWSYREKTRFGRLAQDLIEELVGSCRRKPFALVCGSAEFTKDMARSEPVTPLLQILQLLPVDLGCGISALPASPDSVLSSPPRPHLVGCARIHLLSRQRIPSRLLLSVSGPSLHPSHFRLPLPPGPLRT
ncbi:NADH-cytochrome b5 reductase-like isoform X1 [Neofelis nebulosa]|uniref:NADH-cytochrome b5 reductase-like isoform X1 n=1 Tax=Neofelis nebulosa TaxID=61452 RepID=UPI00272C3522|nr:NADH-cytochrome b5 reductase-like isoform X1 [Neofelis nebulosa]XP_058551859.1 NADH-cytochrome b5 reductase-like isoform X1 [Neofelis nebulosa]